MTRKCLVLLYSLLWASNALQNDGILVKKCCDLHQILDAESLKCVPEDLVTPERMTSFLPSYMLNNESNLVTMQLDLETEIQYGQMVTCPNKYELLDLTKPLEYLISSSGRFVSLAGKYTPDFELGPFCIDTAYLKSKLTFRAALICDPCLSNSCVQSCCSHLQMAEVQSGKIQCLNPPNSGFKAPRMPKSLENLTFVKSANRYAECESKNGTMIMSSHYEISNDGLSASIGKSPFWNNTYE